MQTLPVRIQEAKEKENSFFIEIYEIHLRTQVLYLVAADEDIVYDGQKYTAIPVKRGSVTRSMDSIVNECELEVGDCTDDLLAYVMNGFDFRGSMCLIRRILYPESLNNPEIFGFIFAGEIDEPQFADGVFTCKVTSQFPHVSVPTRDYQVACNSEFGDAECCANKGIANLEVRRGQGNIIYLSNAYPKDYWRHGTIKIAGEARIIIESHDNQITTNVNFLQEIDGKTAELSRGCNKTFEWCKSQYNNAIHFSGFPAVPWESEYR